ncbi:MAG: hypothetical protein WD772_03835 [Pseudohongiellaceae bacterium]
MNRWKASLIHLVVSVVVCAALLLVIVNFWFPGILVSLDGGWTGLKIVTGVDVVLGPLLTLVVFRAGKPGLKFDMACIVAAQVACLTAGIWVVFNERPLALVYAFDTFYSVTVEEFEDFGKDPEILKTIPGPNPKLILVQLPENQAETAMIMMESQLSGDPLFLMTERFVPFPDAASAVMRRMDQLRDLAVADLGIERSETESGGCLFARFTSAHNVGYVCYDGERRELSRFFD